MRFSCQVNRDEYLQILFYAAPFWTSLLRAVLGVVLRSVSCWIDPTVNHHLPAMLPEAYQGFVTHKEGTRVGNDDAEYVLILIGFVYFF